jgi:hypothetical protein
MTRDEQTPPNPDHLSEARRSKAMVRRRLQAMIDEHLVADPALLDASLEASLFADLPWKDPSPSGEFEAIQA